MPIGNTVTLRTVKFGRLVSIPGTIEDADADGFLWIRTIDGELFRAAPSECA